jgi:hypothetical protein
MSHHNQLDFVKDIFCVMVESKNTLNSSTRNCQNGPLNPVTSEVPGLILGRTHSSCDRGQLSDNIGFSRAGNSPTHRFAPGLWLPILQVTQYCPYGAIVPVDTRPCRLSIQPRMNTRI